MSHGWKGWTMSDSKLFFSSTPNAQTISKSLIFLTPSPRNRQDDFIYQHQQDQSMFCTWRSSAISSSGRRSSTGLKARFIRIDPLFMMAGNNTHLKRILSVILLKMLSPVVYGSFWKSEMVLQTTSVLVLCCFMEGGSIVFECPPVTVKEWDEIKLGEGLVERCSSFVGEHEEGIVAACASHAHKLPQSLQEVIRTWDGQGG